MLKICGAAIIAVILSVILKRRDSALSPYIGEMAAVTIIFTIITSIAPFLNFIKGLAVSSAEGDAVSVLLKACSVAIICQTVLNICKSHGENSLAYAVEFAGNTEIIILSLPYLKKIFGLIFGGLGL